VNWLLVIAGIVCIIIELALGPLTGFDLALLGASLTVGGAIGAIAGSAKIGLLASGILAFIYCYELLVEDIFGFRLVFAVDLDSLNH